MGDEELIRMLDPHEVNVTDKAKSARWPQLMIFLNGTILTVAAVITLFIYMDRLSQQTITETAEYFINDFSDSIIRQTDILNTLNTKIDFEIGEKTALLQSVESIGKLIRTPSGQWSVKSIYNKNGMDKTYLKALISAPKSNTKISYILTNKNNLSILKRLDNNKYYFLRLKNNIVTSTLSQARYDTIHRMRLFDAKTGMLIMSYETNAVSKLALGVLSKGTYDMVVNGHTFTLNLDIAKNDALLLGDKLPFILLLFGGALTLVGTLFVRNNQRQSYQMNMMNEVLAEKNDTLEYKIEEAESISRALRESEEEYRAVVNSVHDVLFELDVTGRIVFLNASWVRLTKFEIADVYGDDIFKFLHPSQSDSIRTHFFDFVKNQSYTKLPARVQTLKGDYRSVDIAFSVIRNDSDNIPHVIGTITDIEEKARAERALDEAEKRYRKIVENAAGGIYQIDAQGKVMSANTSFLHILGYASVDEIQSDDFNIGDIYINKDDRVTYESILMKHDQLRNHEVQVRHKNGHIIWINENARLVRDNDEQIQYYEGSIEDITQRKTAEKALIEAKLNSDLASRAKSEFLANMSHELRTPLNSIIGFSEIIKGEALGEIEHRPYVDYAKDIHNSGTRLLNVINEILGISKIEAGERQLNESIVDLKEISQTCTNLMASKIESSGLHINNLIDDATPNIVAEELSMKQILMNLLSNAIKFTPENGTITLSTDYNGTDLRLSITDTGVGIDEADIPKALSPFGQLNNTLSRSNAGTGLGLTLVESLMRMHEGTLELVSQKGFGTTVTLVIPTKRVATKKEKKNAGKDSKITNISDYKDQA